MHKSPPRKTIAQVADGIYRFDLSAPPDVVRTIPACTTSETPSFGGLLFSLSQPQPTIPGGRDRFPQDDSRSTVLYSDGHLQRLMEELQKLRKPADPAKRLKHFQLDGGIIKRLSTHVVQALVDGLKADHEDRGQPFGERWIMAWRLYDKAHRANAIHHLEHSLPKLFQELQEAIQQEQGKGLTRR